MSNYAVMPIADYVGACDAIREKTESAELIKSGDMAGQIGAVYDAGVKAEYDRFWDGYQAQGRRNDYNNGFRNPYWNDNTYNPKYEIVATGFAAAFATSKITDTKVPITSNNLNQAFQNCTSLVNIRLLKLDNFTGTYTNAFQNCNALENVIFEGSIDKTGLNLQWSTLLSKASIESIVNALSDTTSGLAVTLSQTAVNNAFETTAGAADGSTSDEWLDLVATKPNWTITLI